MVFSRASFLVPGSQSSLENTGDLSVFAKRLPQGTSVLAYKIVRFCLLPLSVEFYSTKGADGRGQNSGQVDNLTRLRSRNYSFKIYAFATFAGPFLTLSRALDATLLFLLLFLFAGTFSLAFIHAFCLRA
jgi:hypothetical protein